MIQQAHDAYNKQDYEVAIELYKKLANEDNAEAQTSLAFMYQNAQGCEKNETEALKNYLAAAQKKQPYALFNLALLYANGTGGVLHDQYKAYELYLEAAVLEVPPAMYEVALMLERGLGCMANFSESAFWYEEAAKRGHIEAFNNLGVLYKEGHGVAQDYQRAFICFSRAAEKNLPTAQYNLGLLYDQGLGCDQDHDKALEWCRKAAFGGHESAKSVIAKLQEDGTLAF